MPQNPNKITQFWQELKRRKVFRVIAMYAATAFIILEAVDIVFPRWGLPDWSVNLVILLLIIGFIVTAILAWIFDITPEGVKKTESMEIDKEQELSLEPGRRKLRVSDLINAVLVVVICILLYPKIFKKDKFEDIREEDGRISIAVMPFENLTGDTTLNWFQRGISSLIINGLGNSSELVVCDDYTIHEVMESMDQVFTAGISSSQARKVAEKVMAESYISGSYQGREDTYWIMANLVNTKNGDIIWTIKVKGDLKSSEYLDLTDSLCNEIKNYLEIRVLKQEADYDLRDVYTNSAQAYKYFIQGMDSEYADDRISAIAYFKKAIELDSSFISAYISLARTYYNEVLYENSEKCVKEAYKYYKEIPIILQFKLDEYIATLGKDMHEVIRLKTQILELEPNSRREWHSLGWAYDQLHQFENAIMAYEKVLEIDRQWGGGWKWPATYDQLGYDYHQTGNHKRENEIYELALDVLPDHPDILYRQAICALSLGDTSKGNECITKLTSQARESGYSQSELLSEISQIYEGAKIFDKEESHIRQALKLDPQNQAYMHHLAWFLINNDVNVSEGLELINQVLEISPDEPHAMQVKGWGLFKHGKYEQALETLKKAWDMIPYYNHEFYLHIQQVEKALANQNK